mmetsp:Transcript_94699/g.253276  ORF Transcript_94699/g.253276 Transcript_94699/m.253276 type:complete len:478 (-) Transcript_94699:429-1862(-)
MLVYNNTQVTRIILQLYGSVIWSWQVVIPGLLAALVAEMFQYARHVDAEFGAPDVKHHYANNALGVIVGFAVVFRVNLAWSRYWEATAQTQFMFSKWCDAFMQVNTFITTSVEAHLANGARDKAAFLAAYRRNILHWMSMLSALAVDRLIRGDIGRQQHVKSWRERVVRREMLRFRADDSKELPRFKHVEMNAGDEVFLPGLIETVLTEAGLPVPADEGRKRATVARLCDETKKLKAAKQATKADLRSRANLSGSSMEQQSSWGQELFVLVPPSEAEIKMLEMCTDRVQCCLSWLTEGVSRCQPYLITPPPILSRCYQELSNGMLGFNQALKLADIPFPFPYAQLLAVVLVVFFCTVPVYVCVFTDSLILTPIACYMLTVGILSLNLTAQELENPFGDDVNDLPLIDGHERFLDTLFDNYHTTVPADQRAVTELSQLGLLMRFDRQRETSPLSKTNQACGPNLAAMMQATAEGVDRR